MPADFSTRIRNIQKFIGVAETGVFDLATCKELEKRGNIIVNSDNLVTHIKNVQRMVNADDDGVVGPQTMTKVEAFLNPVLPKTAAGSSLVVSVKSIDALVMFEVTSKEKYERRFQHPVFPGKDSGLTIGIGYDLGQNNKKDITDSWGPLVSTRDLNLLLSVAGKSGLNAKNLLPTVISVKIPFVSANKVFFQVTVPRFAKIVRKIYPGVEKLPPDAQGALLSLVYNRGGSFTRPSEDQRIEMKNIASLVAAGDLAGIAKEIRKMKRHFTDPNSKGLLPRRDKEADMVANASFNILPEDQIMV